MFLAEMLDKQFALKCFENFLATSISIINVFSKNILETFMKQLFTVQMIPNKMFLKCFINV